MAKIGYGLFSNRKKNEMKTANTIKLVEATIAAVAIFGLAVAIVPSMGIAAAGVLVAGGLAAMAALEAKGRVY